MGNCVSNSEDREAKARSDAIDRQIEEDQKKFKKECKILLLGMFLSLCLFFVSLDASAPLVLSPRIPCPLTHDVHMHRFRRVG